MASEIIETKLVVEGEEQYLRSIKNCSEAVKTLRSELAETASEYRNNTDSIEKLKDTVELLTKMYNEQKKKLEELNKQLGEFKNNTKKLAKEEEEVNGQLKEQSERLEEVQNGNEELTETLIKYKQELDYAQIQLNKLNDELAENAKQMQQVENNAERATESVREFGSSIEKAIESADELSGESADSVSIFVESLDSTQFEKYADYITTALSECVGAAKEFEKGMKESFTLLPGLTDDVKEKMSEDMLQFSTRMNVLTEDALPALYHAISAGVPEENVFDFLETAQKAAVGGVTDLGLAVDTLTSITNAYNGEAEDTTQIADQMFTAVNLGKTSFGELSQNIGNVIPTAAAAKVSFGDISAALAVMTEQGVPTADATVKLQQMLAELTDSGSKVSKTFEGVAGKGFKQFIEEGNNVQDALQLLEKYAKRTGIGTDALFSSVEAGSSALLLTGSASGKFTEALTAMKRSAGAVDAAYEEMAESAAYQSKRLEVSFENLKTATGEALLPVLSELESAGADALGWLTGFMQEHPVLIQMITGAAAGIAALSVGLTGYKIATELAAIASEFFSSSFGPLGLAVTALGAALAVFVPLINNFVSGITDGSPRIAEMTENAKALAGRIGDANAKFEENKDSIENTSGIAGIYIDQLKSLEAEMKDLEKQGKNVTDQQAQYRVLVGKLNQEMPELNAQIDEQTGLLKDGTQALESQIENWEELALQRAYEEKYAEIYQAQAEATLELQENEMSLNETMAEGEVLREERAQILQELMNLTGVSAEQMNEYLDLNLLAAQATGEHGEQISNLALRVSELDGEIAENAYAQSECQEAIEISKEALAEATETVDAAGKTWIELRESQKTATEIAPEIAEAYGGIQNATDGMITKMNDLQAAYQESYNRAYDSISGQMKLFKDYELDASISVSGISKSLDDQIGFMANYSNNMRILSSWGIDEGLLKSLSDGSVESASILQAIVDGGQEKIGELNEKFSKVKDGKKEFADTIGQIESNFSEEMDKVVKRAESMALGLNQRNQAYDSSVETMQGAIDGLRSKYRELEGWYNDVQRMGMQAANADRGYNPHMSGLATVPYDGYLAELHKGERILTATQARAYDIARSIAVPVPTAPHISQYIPQQMARSETSGEKSITMEALAETVGRVVREMLHGAEVVLDDEKVGEFAVRKVTEEAFA